MTVPILRKQPEGAQKALEMEFRIVTDPTFDDDGEMTSPPHWELRDKAREDPLGWGPIDTAPMVWRLFAIAALASEMIPGDELARRLAALGSPEPIAAERLA